MPTGASPDLAVEDSIKAFWEVPWTAELVNKPGLVFAVPESRFLKANNEDSLYAYTLRTYETFRSCIYYYESPPDDQLVDECSTLIMVGKGVDGHSGVMHGGVVSTILDETAGILQIVNLSRQHLIGVQRGLIEKDAPRKLLGSFTGELKVKFLKQVRTPGPLLVKSRYLKKDGRKELILSEIWQRYGTREGHDGDLVLCATGEALMIWPRGSKM